MTDLVVMGQILSSLNISSNISTATEINENKGPSSNSVNVCFKLMLRMKR